MHHYFEALTNTSGESLIGYFARVIDRSTQSAVTLASDENGTPIVTVSGHADMAKTDDYGNLDFYVEPGTYHLDIYAPDATTFRYRVPNVGMSSTQGERGPQGEKGDPGAAGNVAANLTQLGNAATTNTTMIYDQATFTWTTGDFSALIDNVNYVASSSTPSTSGAWVRQSSTKVAHKPTGTGTRMRTSAQVMDEVVYASNFTGYDETGVTDSSAAIMAADAVARSRNKTLILSGTPLVTQTLLIDAPTNWRMQGTHFKPGFPNAGPRIIKPATMNATVIRITPNAYQTVLDGIAIAGITGNGGDGIHIEADCVTLLNCSVFRMGQDGVRIGSKVANPYQAGPPAVNYNANCFNLISLHSAYNGRDGLHINDLSGVTNANAGAALRPVLVANGRHGLYVNNAYLGNSFISPLGEANGTTDPTGRGVYFDTNALHQVVIGGDLEANTGGDYFEAVPGANCVYGAVGTGVRIFTQLAHGSWTPTIIGSTTAGTATYTTQRGHYSVSGRMVSFMAEIVWSGHTGTGDLRVTGFPFSPLSVDSSVPNFVPATIVSSGITLAAGAQLKAGFNHNGNFLRVWTSNTGTLTTLAMQTAGTLYIQGAFMAGFPS
ncbi:MAG: hypothetical protein J7500_15825 [Sphingomonas sp.]|uniref:hypothetical protein n=1 Tax=Sphingomonas sp. TaxID=28214 RepID=UPI001B143A56|nr:hypothetical protein [Sphingomonas sp.]MBO9624177.1 hypothetical protein [Sphingomonas sp.]